MSASSRRSALRSRAPRSDNGFSLIEIVIAMLLLALMSIGLIPLLFGIVQASTQNRAQVSATAYADAIISELRQFGAVSDKSCAAVAAWTPPPAPPESGLTATLKYPPVPPDAPDTIDCPTAYPGTVAIIVEIQSGPATDRKLTAIRTEVLVTSAS